MIERLMDKRLIKWILITALITAAIGIGMLIQPHVHAAPLSAPLHFDGFTCTPIGVAAFTTRVHVHCATPFTYTPAGGTPVNIYWFAFSNRDSATASRMLSLATSAQLAGKTVLIYFTKEDLSGESWGCQTGDCRVMWGMELR